MQICSNCGVGNLDGQKFCGNCGTALDQPRQVEGERKFASFLFADVAQSTALAENMDPEDWTNLMNGAFAFMNAAVTRYGGTVSRLMGDAVLALFGAPVAHEDDAERAVRAGLDLQEAARSYHETVKERHGIDFYLRVGIHTGTAVLAFVGDAIRTEYTAMGDAANVAARLQSAAEPGSVLISADTYNLVRGQVEVRPRGPIAMKGKLAPVDAFEVTCLKAVPGNSRGLEGLSSPIVGRAAEMAALSENLDALLRGQGSAIAIVGEAGLGKSRLLAEFRDGWLARAGPGALWIEGRAISYGQAVPYLPWRQVTRQILGAGEMDAAAIVRAKLAAFATLHGLSGADVSLLETMMSVETDESRSRVAGLSGEAVAEGIAHAVTAMIKGLIGSRTDARPLVLVMDDLHWSDTSSIELVVQIATLATYAPLMVAGVMRPRRTAASWQMLDRLEASLGSDFRRMNLEPLGTADANALLGNLLEVRNLPPQMRALILERADGNPFYIEEILRSLIDGGQIVRDGDHWRATSAILSTKIPETLAGVLSARIDRLPASTKRVAQTAAVIGRIFPHRLLQTVCMEAPPNERVEPVEPHIAALSLEQVVRERSREPDREYIFKHIMTCEAAYNLLLRSRRRELHARTGLAIEREVGDRLEEYAAILAHHFSEADDYGRAISYARQAADRAASLYAAHEELEHRERIMGLLERMPSPDSAVLVDSTIAWAMVRHRLNLYDGVVARLERAIAVARVAGDRRRLASALSWTGNLYILTGHPSLSGPYIEESRGLALELGDEHLMLLPLFVATWFMTDRDPEAAIGALQHVIELTETYKIGDLRGHAIAYLAIALARRGRFPEARAQVERALKAMPDAIAPVKQADVHIGVGFALAEMGDFRGAMEHNRIGAAMADAAKGFECSCVAHFSLGRTHMALNELDTSMIDFDRASAAAKLARTDSMQGFAATIAGSVAEVRFEQGEAAAVDKMRDSISLMRSGGDEFGATWFALQLAQALIRLGRTDEAEPHVLDSVAMFRQRGIVNRLAGALDILAMLNEAQGRGADAVAARAEAETLRAGFETVPTGSQQTFLEPA